MRALPRQIFHFGQFTLDVDAQELVRDGRQVKLQPQPFKLLLLIVRRAGAVVSRDEIRAELWPEGTFVDFDQAVNFAIKQVRDALGDSAENPLYVQTLPRRGYRFIAPVDAPALAGAGQMPPPLGTTTVRLQKALWTNIAELKMAQERQRRMMIAAIVVAAAVLVSVAVYLIVR